MKTDLNHHNAVYNILGLAGISFLQALQLLIILSVVQSFLPIAPAPFTQKIFAVYLPEVRPEREMTLYRLFVFMAMGIQAAWVYVLRRRLDERMLWKHFLSYAVHTAFWIFIQLFAVFKIFCWGDPAWARTLLYGSLAAAVISHIFWPEVQRLATRFYLNFTGTELPRWPWMWDAGFVAGLFFLIWPKHLDFVLGRMFVRDQFYHLDSFFMTPGWAHLKGLLLNQDITSQYSVVYPIAVSQVLKNTIGFDYPQVVALLLLLVIVYYIGTYVVLCLWLSSRVLAAFGVLLILKLQLFHWGVAPLVWQYPSATPLRHLADMAFFFFLWKHIQSGHVRWFWSAAAAAGLMMALMLDAGVYLLGAFMIYSVLSSLGQNTSPWPVIQRTLTGTGAVVAVAAAVIWSVQPATFFDPAFWGRAFEFASMFMQGWGAMPMTEGLKDKQFFAFVMGFAIPIAYVLTLVYMTGQIIWQRSRKQNLMVIVLCVYGLGLYHYYIHRSGVTSYYAVCVPFVMMVCFWIKSILQRLSPALRRLSGMGLAASTLAALLTSYFFTYYPNALNLGGLDWQNEARYYRQQFDFKEDANLIRSLTSATERVALISSFETKILMQADRAPFFYYSPMVESSLDGTPDMRHTYLLTYPRVQDTLRQLEAARPAYIFIQKKYLAFDQEQGYRFFLEYLGSNYVQDKQGMHLMAYKRKMSL